DGHGCGGKLESQRSDGEKSENDCCQITVSDGACEGIRQTVGDKARHEEHQAVDTQAGIKQKRRESLLGMACSDRGPEVQVRGHTKGDECNGIADKEVDVVAGQFHDEMAPCRSEVSC